MDPISVWTTSTDARRKFKLISPTLVFFFSISDFNVTAKCQLNFAEFTMSGGEEASLRDFLTLHCTMTIVEIWKLSPDRM